MKFPRQPQDGGKRWRPSRRQAAAVFETPPTHNLVCALSAEFRLFGKTSFGRILRREDFEMAGGRPADPCRPASRTVGGGDGRARPRAPGLPPSRSTLAPRWMARTALAWRWSISQLSAAEGTSVTRCVGNLLLDAGAREAFLRRVARRTSVAAARNLATILDFKAAKARVLTRDGQGLKRIVQSLIDVARRHHGSAAEPLDIGVPRHPGGTRQRPLERILAASEAAQLREAWAKGVHGPPQPVHALLPHDRTATPRLLRTMRAMRLETMHLPRHAILCPERASKALAEGVPERAVHVDSLPTAVASAADHYFLPTLGRFVRPEELCAFFSLPMSAARGVLSSPAIIPARRACQCLGGAIHPGVAAAVTRRALALCPQLRAQVMRGRPVRYASACSGVDLFAQGLDQVLGPSAWTYVMASERDGVTARALHRIYHSRGLRRSAIREDACSAAACERGAQSDIWVASADCSPFSAYNRLRSEARTTEALFEFDRILDYVRAKTPRLVIVENVDMPDAVHGITAALASLRGYKLFRQVICPSWACGAIMVRRRMFWVAVRGQSPG